jgi:hypothetical protein
VLHSVMEAASGIDRPLRRARQQMAKRPSPKIVPKEEVESPDTTAVAGTPKDDGSKRFLPDHKKDAALRSREGKHYLALFCRPRLHLGSL